MMQLKPYTEPPEPSHFSLFHHEPENGQNYAVQTGLAAYYDVSIHLQFNITLT